MANINPLATTPLNSNLQAEPASSNSPTEITSRPQEPMMVTRPSPSDVGEQGNSSDNNVDTLHTWPYMQQEEAARFKLQNAEQVAALRINNPDPQINLRPSQQASLEAVSQKVEEKVSIYGEASRPVFESAMEEIKQEITAKKKKTMLASAYGKISQSNPASEAVHRFEKKIDHDALYASISYEIQAMQSKAENKPVIPQFVIKDDGSLGALIAPQSVQSLAFSGGGAKGFVYPTVIGELENHSQLDQLKTVIGTSVGSLGAIAVAYSASPEEMEAIVKAVQSGFKNDRNIGLNYPQVNFDPHSSGTMKLADTTARYAGKMAIEAGGRAEKTVQALDNFSLNNVQKALGALGKEKRNELIEQASSQLNIDSRKITDRLETLMKSDMSGDRTGKMITFNDQAILHQMMPDLFKNISVVAVDFDTSESLLLSKDTTPDMPVAFGVRASIALLGLTTHIKLSPELGTGSKTLSDGGMGSLTPTEGAMMDLEQLKGLSLKERTLQAAKIAREPLPEKNVEVAMAKATTMNIQFDNGGSTAKKMHGSPEKLVKSAVSTIDTVLGFKPDAVAADNQKLFHNRTLIANSGKIARTDIDPSYSKLNGAKMAAKIDTANQIRQRLSEPVMLDLKDVSDLLPLLSEEEKAAILAKGRPEMHTANIQEEDHSAKDALIASQKLFELVSEASSEQSYR